MNKKAGGSQMTDFRFKHSDSWGKKIAISNLSEHLKEMGFVFTIRQDL